MMHKCTCTYIVSLVRIYVDMILNTMCFIWASNRVLKSERVVHMVRCNKGRKPYVVHM